MRTVTSNIPLAAGVYTLTAMIVFYNYVIDMNIVFHTLGIHSHNNVPVQYKTA
jgi:nitrogen fixation protein FixH